MVGIWTCSRLRLGFIINYMFSDVTEKKPRKYEIMLLYLKDLPQTM